jgi:hypothetical protein
MIALVAQQCASTPVNIGIPLRHFDQGLACTLTYASMRGFANGASGATPTRPMTGPTAYDWSRFVGSQTAARATWPDDALRPASEIAMKNTSGCVLDDLGTSFTKKLVELLPFGMD